MGEQGPVWIRWPYARIRRELETEQGEVTRFLAQLEYDIRATPTGKHSPDWRPVARFDHDSHGELAHDIRVEGLHLNLFKHGEKYKVLTGFPPIPLNRAFRYSELYLTHHAGHFLEQFERWHDLCGLWRTHDSE